MIAALPEERVGVALLMNLRGAQTARTAIATTALRLLAQTGPRTSRRAPAGRTKTLAGHYRPNFWDMDVDVYESGSGLELVVRPGGILAADTASRLETIDAGRLLARGGMFDGLELVVDSSGATPRISGGIYPFTFERTGDAAPRRAPAPDPDLPLAGTWQGETRSPLGPLPVSLAIGTKGATIDLLTARGETLERYRESAGRVEGEFSLEVPTVGPFTVFVRLVAAGGRLTGPLYARGEFGEFPMATELERLGPV